MITQEHIEAWFTYHPPQNASQKAKYEELREGAKAFAEVVLKTTPACADQTAAIRKIREAVMTANAAIACDGHLPAHPLEKKVSGPPDELHVDLEKVAEQITLRLFWDGEFVLADRVIETDLIAVGNPRQLVEGFLQRGREALLKETGQVVKEDVIWQAVTQAAADIEKRVRRNPLRIGG